MSTRQRICFVSILVYSLLTIDYRPIYAQNAQITAPSDVQTDTMTFDPQASAPTSPVEGQIYFNNTDKQLYFRTYNNTWKSFGAGSGGDKVVATRIVAASNSLDTTCSAGSCVNTKADYTCDGTDDQNEINLALGDLASTGGVVYLLDGAYNLSGNGCGCGASTPHYSIIICNAGKPRALIGSGPRTVLRAVDTGMNVITIKKISLVTGSSIDNILVSQLTIDGNGVAQSGIDLSDAAYCKIDKVWIKNIVSGSYGQAAIQSLGSESYNHHNVISGCVIQYNQAYGIIITDSYDLVYNNIIQNNSNAGIMTSSISATPDGYNIISDNSLETCGSGITLSGPQNVVINNTVKDCVGSGISANNSGGSSILSNSLQGNNDKGIYLLNSADCNIFSNNIQTSNGSGIFLASSSNNSISSNVIFGNGIGYIGGGPNSDAIYLDGLSSANIISANRIFSTIFFSGASYGINVSGGDQNYIVGNLIYDDNNYYSKSYDVRIKDTGTNTGYTDKTKLSFEPGSYNISSGILTPSGPTSYLRLTVSAAIHTIAAGTSVGDILILESAVNNFVISAGVSFKTHTGGVVLNTNNVLILIWDGSMWVEI